MATINDVAKAARVSIATVSACVNGSAPVSPALRRRVEDAVARTGYRPDAVARSLKTGLTRTLGLAVDDLGDPVAAAIAQAVARAVGEKAYAVILAGGGDVAALEARRVEGIVLLPARGDGSSAAGARPKRCPAVMAGAPGADATIDSASWDHALAADAAVEHLAALGHGRIALVIGQDHVPQGERILEGYRRALTRHAIRFQPRLVRVAAPGKAKPDRKDQARATARALLAGQDWPTGLIVCGGALALGMMGAMEAAGLACPAGMSIVALGDAAWAEHSSPPLTAVAEPAQEIGAEAVGLLLERLRDGAGPAPRRIFLPGRLVLRASTAAPAARD
ncbi:MAG: LacI family DNA-binding transcriptional regulator [Rhodospirillales bacterium]